MKFHCPHCGTKLEIAPDQPGTAVACPACKKDISVPGLTLGPGVALNEFVIEKRLGAGNMGEVFLARQQSMDRLVALKVLPERFSQDRTLTERFLKEVRLTARLEHPNIVMAHAAGCDQGHHYLAMSFVDGESLQAKLEREGPLLEADVLRIALKLADALAYAWEEQQLLHRDIKPANIMLDHRGEVRLMDLGLAKSLGEDSALTMTGQFLGTPYYVSPEQAQGVAPVDSRSDIYSLGATLYHLLCGAPPFDATTFAALVTRLLSEEPMPLAKRNPAVSLPTSALIARMMAKDPAQRPADWRAVQRELQQVLTNLVTPTLAAPPRPVKKPPVVAAAPARAAKPTTTTRPVVAAAQPIKKRLPVWAGPVIGAVCFLILLGLLAAGAQRDQEKRATQLLQRSKTLLDQGRPGEAAKLLEPQLPKLKPDLPQMKALRENLATAKALTALTQAQDEAQRLANEKEPVKAYKVLRDAVAAAPPGVTPPAATTQLLATLEARATTARLRQRAQELAEGFFAQNVEKCAEFADPDFVRQHGVNGVKLLFGLASGFCKLANVGLADFEMGEIRLSADGQRGEVAFRLRVNGQWQKQDPIRCLRVGDQWYVDMAPAPKK